MEKQIPGFSNYTIDEKGVVREIASGGIIVPEVGRRGFEFRVTIKNDLWRVVRPKVSRLVMMTFQPIPDIEYDWISVLYRSGVYSDLSLGNLVWDFEGYTPPIDPLLPMFQDHFVRIPGFSRYEISPSGVLRNATTKDIFKPGLSSVGYLCNRVSTDYGKSTYVGIHHLMALALLPHPTDVDQLVINHLNGVKTENHPSNIEWATYSRNVHHAHYTGLRSSIIPVYAKSATTGEVVMFDSLNDAARFFGNANPGKIHWWLHNGSKDKIREGWYVSLTNDWASETMSRLTEM